jgi:uncharacterized protein YaeQ
MTLTMALPSTIYRVNMQLADINRGVYETFQTTVARHPSETEERLVARLLAMALFFESELTFTKGLSATDEPDLWVIGPDGRVRLWVEVGLPDAERIIKACRHSERVALLASGRTVLNWDQQHLPKLGGVSNLIIASVDQTFINNLSSRLERSINWSITITEAILYLTCGNETCETAIQIKKGTL